MILLRWPRTWKLRSNPTLIRSLKKTLAFLSTSDMSCVNKGDQQKGRKPSCQSVTEAQKKSEPRVGKGGEETLGISQASSWSAFRKKLAASV